jgi:hypothetical protein
MNHNEIGKADFMDAPMSPATRQQRQNRVSESGPEYQIRRDRHLVCGRQHQHGHLPLRPGRAQEGRLNAELGSNKPDSNNSDLGRVPVQEGDATLVIAKSKWPPIRF